MPFLGRESVERARDRAQSFFGKVQTGLLTASDGSGSVTYSYVYAAPIDEHTGMGDDMPRQIVMIYAFQFGEKFAPRADDNWTINGITFLITTVTTTCNADPGYAIYKCRSVAQSDAGPVG